MARKKGSGAAPGGVREVAAAYGLRAGFGADRVRKNHYLYQWKLDLAKRILDVSTETEALDAALDALIYGEALALGTEAMAGEEYVDMLGIGKEIPEAPAEE